MASSRKGVRRHGEAHPDDQQQLAPVAVADAPK